MRTIAAVVKIVANSRLNPNLRITSITSLATPPAPAGVKAMLYGLIKPESVWARARGTSKPAQPKATAQPTNSTRLAPNPRLMPKARACLAPNVATGESELRLAEDQMAERVGDVVVIVAAGVPARRRLDQDHDLLQVVVGDLFLGPGDLQEPLPGGVVGGMGGLQPQLGEPV